MRELTWAEAGSLIERHRIVLTPWPDGSWGADIPGGPGDPIWYPDPRKGEPGHVLGTAMASTALEAIRFALVDAGLEERDGAT